MAPKKKAKKNREVKLRHNKNDNVYHLLKLLASKTQVQRYLDIGCGPNCTVTTQVALKLRVQESYGLDTISEFKKPNTVSDCVTLKEDLKIDFPSKSLDLVTCYTSLHHFDRLELPLVLREIRRVLKHGGYFFVREIDGGLEEFCHCR